MGIFLTLKMPTGKSRARVLGLAAFALVALACGVEASAAAKPAESPVLGGAIARTEDSVDAAPGPADVVEARPEADSAASAAALSEAPAALEAQETDEPPETLMLSPGLTDFTLPSGLGNEVTLSSYLGAQNVMVVFYRAWW